MLQSTAEQKEEEAGVKEKNYSVAQNLFYIFHPVWKEKPHYMLMLIGGSEHRDDADGCSSERSCGIESGKRK